MTEAEVLKEFKIQFTIFFDELISQFPHEGDLVVMRLLISTQLSIVDTVNLFIYQINTKNGEQRQMIKDRNEVFFLKYEVTQETNDKYKLSHFKKLWRSGVLDDEDKRVIWQWIDTFVFLADKYTKSLNPL